MDDYSSESNQSVLIFNSNNTEYTVQILIMNDTIQEPMEIFAAQLALMNQSSQTVTLSPDRVLIIIEDDDSELHIHVNKETLLTAIHDHKWLIVCA